MAKSVDKMTLAELEEEANRLKVQIDSPKQKSANAEMDLSKLSDEELETLANNYKSQMSAQTNDEPPLPTQEAHPNLNMLKDFLKGAAQENINLGTGFYNAANRGLIALLQSQGLNFPTPKPVNFNIMNNITYPTAASLGRGAGILATAFTPTGAVARVPLIGKGIAGLLDLAQLKPLGAVSRRTLGALERKNLNNWLTRTAVNAAEGATSGATYGAALGANKEGSNLGEEALSSALFGAGLGALLPQLGEAFTASKNRKINKLIKDATSGASNMKTPQEAARDLPLVGDLPIDLGSFIKNPHLAKEFEVKYGRTGEGQRSAVEPLRYLRDKAENFMQNIGGKYQNNPADIVTDLKTHMRGQLRLHEKNVSDAFENVINEAEKAKITTNQNPKFSKVAQKFLDEDKRLASEERTPILRGAADLKEVFERGAKNYQGAKERSLYGLDQERKVLGTLKKKYKKLDNQLLATMAENGERAIQEDIENILQNKGRNDLAIQWKDARKLFATKVAAYRPKRIKNMLEGITNPDNLIDVLTHPQHQPIFEDLTPDLRRGLIYRHLLNKTGEEIGQSGVRKIDPTTLIRNYDKLVSKTDAKRLFSPSELNELDEIKKLNRMLETAKHIEKPPRTGFYASLEDGELGKNAYKYLLGPLLTGGVGYLGAHAGQSPIQILSELAGVGLTTFGAKKANKMIKEKSAKFLTSPEAKKAFAKGEKIKRKSVSGKNRAAQLLLEEYLNS